MAITNKTVDSNFKLFTALTRNSQTKHTLTSLAHSCPACIAIYASDNEATVTMHTSTSTATSIFFKRSLLLFVLEVRRITAPPFTGVLYHVFCASSIAVQKLHLGYRSAQQVNLLAKRLIKNGLSMWTDLLCHFIGIKSFVLNAVE